MWHKLCWRSRYEQKLSFGENSESEFNWSKKVLIVTTLIKPKYRLEWRTWLILKWQACEKIWFYPGFIIIKAIKNHIYYGIILFRLFLIPCRYEIDWEMILFACSQWRTVSGFVHGRSMMDHYLWTIVP